MPLPSVSRLIKALVIAVLVSWTIVSVQGTLRSAIDSAREDETDLTIILDSSRQWRDGLPLYEARRLVHDGDDLVTPNANLNHPITIPLLVPLTYPRPSIAFFVWDAIGLTAFLGAVAATFRASRIRPTPIVIGIAGAAILTCPGLSFSISSGQFGLLLAAPVVGTWLLLRSSTEANRRRRTIAAGILLGALVLLKPFLLPMLMLLLPRHRRPGLVAAAATGAALSLVALPMVGWTGYTDWLDVLGTIDWYGHGLNVSLDGFLYRVVSSDLPQLTGWVLQAVALVVAALVLRRTDGDRPADVDRSVGIVLLLSLLLSPLGWIYYTPMLLPAVVPAVATWPALPPPRRTHLLGALLLLWSPHIWTPLWPGTLLGDLTVRAAPTYGMVLLVAFLLTAEATDQEGWAASPTPDSAWRSTSQAQISST